MMPSVLRRGPAPGTRTSASTAADAEVVRLEQQIAWTRLLERLESMRYGPDNNFLHQPGIMLGTLQLNLELVKAAK